MVLYFSVDDLLMNLRLFRVLTVCFPNSLKPGGRFPMCGSPVVTNKQPSLSSVFYVVAVRSSF